MERIVALLCNPSAGGGRASRVLPEVEAALRELDVCFHTAMTRSLFSLRLDGEPLAFTGYSVAAGNSTSYGGGMLLAPGAQLDDGLLDVVTIAALSKPRFLTTLPQVFKGTHVGHPAVRVRRARELHVSADRSFAVYADSDPIGQTPTTIRVPPRAVRVLAPR